LESEKKENKKKESPTEVRLSLNQVLQVDPKITSASFPIADVRRSNVFCEEHQRRLIESVV